MFGHPEHFLLTVVAMLVIGMVMIVANMLVVARNHFVMGVMMMRPPWVPGCA